MRLGISKPQNSYEVLQSKTQQNPPITLPETNIAMENGPFEDVFPIETGDIPAAMLVYQRVHPPKSFDS